jgi:hypothetical protein
LNPDATIPRQFKLKEHYVMDALKEHYKDTLTMTFDKMIEGGCSKHRPDLFIDFGTHCLIIEIDENQHTNYSCEQKRMISLYEDINGHTLINSVTSSVEDVSYINGHTLINSVTSSVEDVSDIDFRKIVFIRFNPDGYNEGSQKYKSPFGYTPTGMISINKDEMTRRIARLVDQIDAVKEEPSELLTIHYLFFTSL